MVQFEFLKKLSNPLWFQAFGCVLGFDWNSSGVTTVVMSVLKQSVLYESHGMAIAGGKGKKSKETTNEIFSLCENSFNFGDNKVKELLYASKMSAKVDNSAIQDGYNLYHHNLVFDEGGNWCVVQQGMNNENNTSRRYHWLSKLMDDNNYVIEPHSGLIGDTYNEKMVLDMTSTASIDNQKTCVDVINDHSNIKDLYLSISPLISRINDQKLDYWIFDNKHNSESPCLAMPKLNMGYSMPENINWDLIKEIHEIHPSSYEKFLSIKGVGPKTVRAISLIAELVFGAKASWEDPVRFTFAFGGKDRVPYPVDRKSYDESISFLQSSIEGSEISRNERVESIKRLAKFNSNLREMG